MVPIYRGTFTVEEVDENCSASKDGTTYEMMRYKLSYEGDNGRRAICWAIASDGYEVGDKVGGTAFPAINSRLCVLVPFTVDRAQTGEGVVATIAAGRGGDHVSVRFPESMEAKERFRLTSLLFFSLNKWLTRLV